MIWQVMFSDLDESGNLVRKPNPEYAQWMREDQLLLSWLLSSLTTPILRGVARYKTSSAVWKALELLFSVRAKARVLPLKIQLHTTRKRSMSVYDYFAKMEGISDSLALAGYEVPEEDLILSILAGLPQEYDVVVYTITHQAETGDLYVQAMVLSQSQEYIIEQQTAAIIELQSATTNLAERSGHGVVHGGRASGSQVRGRGRGRGYYSGNSKPICKICGKQGHIAVAC
ncbi:hypothetical protein L484_012748 [Morus notabilis]|uniref:CCHC-type domain-containing protein n=1 Tax=Morus notabilis TaxID=981085 RepID=W9RWJ0_9ROSA|nr:hypothetical protein L484_012748 [Morus notabilis]